MKQLSVSMKSLKNSVLGLGKTKARPRRVCGEGLHHLILVAILGALGSSCSSDKLAKPSQLSGLRVLAMVADRPEVNDNGSTVNVTPYVSDLNGAGRSLTVQAYGCTDPNVSAGALPNCDLATDRVLLAGYTYDPATAAGTDVLAASSYTGSLTSFSVTIPSGYLNDKTDLQKLTGAAYLVELQISTGAEKVSAIKRILVSNATNLNTNPVIENVLFNNSLFNQGDSYPSIGTFSLSVSAASSESYLAYSTDGVATTLVEKLSIRYFTSRGAFSASVSDLTGSSSFTPSDSTTAAVIGFLVNDGRGGSAIAFRRF